MFTASNVQDVSSEGGAQFTRALADKLVDIDRNRINKSDELVLRKAVFGLIEIVSILEARVAALEGDDAEAYWRAKLETDMGAPRPDVLRIGDDD
ncbi:hypothetical protein [Microbacterium sp. P5_E9]